MVESAEQNVDGRAAGAFSGPVPVAGPQGGPVDRAGTEERGANGEEFVVRAPTVFEARSLAALWAEMQCHYGQPVSDASAAAAAAFACRTGRPGGFEPRVLVAIADTGAVVGSLVLNVTFPAAELTRSLYIRDLYVALGARRRGVARNLLRAAAALTLADGFSALDWTADGRNAGAHRFYERAGAARLDRVYFRLSGSDLRKAAGS